MEIDCSNTIVGDVFTKYIGNRLTFDCINGSSINNSRRLITEYNRSPSILRRSIFDDVKSGFNFDFSGLYKSLIHRNDTFDDKTGSNDITGKTEFNEIPVFALFQKVMCLTGAGVSLVGIGLLSLFGVCAAAGTTCSIAMCNKYIEKNPTLDCTQMEHPENDGRYNPTPAIYIPNEYKPVNHVSNYPRRSAYITQRIF